MMRLLLVSGEEHSYIAACVAERRHTVINKEALTLDCMDEYRRNHALPHDMILITDRALSSNPDENERLLESLTDCCSGVVVITRDFHTISLHPALRIIVSDWFRAREEDIAEALSGRQNETYDEKPEKKKWGARPKKKAEEDISLTAANFDRTSSRAIIFTGHRGSGITSTAVNVALSAVNRNLKTILVDLDTDYRAVNLYFGEFGTQADREDGISASLVRLLAQPQKYDTFAVNADGLWLTSLGYDFSDDKLLQQHFTESKLNGLITSLKRSFDLVVIDFPLDGLARTPSILNNTDSLALCMENNIYSAFTTVRNVIVKFNDAVDISYVFAKAELVVTKFNDESVYDGTAIVPERLGELIVNEGFCDDITTEMPVAGSIPYDKRFDRQIESDIAIIHTDNQMKQAYDGILLRLLGAKR